MVAAHVSHPAALEAADGLVVESCPQYLTLREGEVLDQGAFRKFTPPARARTDADLDAMWSALADGRIDYVSTDHAPSTPEQKRAGSIWDVHFGLPGLDTTFSVLLDGAHAGRITYAARRRGLRRGAGADLRAVAAQGLAGRWRGRRHRAGRPGRAAGRSATRT